MDFLISANYNLLNLFLLSFLASTILPLGSEWLLISLLINGQRPEHVVIIATIGNTLGGLTTFAFGSYGSNFITNKILRISKGESERAMKIYQKYGYWSLLLSWLPIIGDPLCFLAGSLKLSPLLATSFIFLGKFTRYFTLAFITINGMKIG